MITNQTRSKMDNIYVKRINYAIHTNLSKRQTNRYDSLHSASTRRQDN